MRMSLFGRLTLVFSIVLLAGCAATVNQSTPSSSAVVPRAQVPAGALALLVTASATMQSSADWPAFVEEWETSMTYAAGQAKTPFVFVKDGTAVPTGTATLVRVTVNDFKYVSQVKRYMLGILAGNAWMDVYAEYFDLPANTPFGAKKFNTSSSTIEGVFSAMTPKQVQAVSDQILKDVMSDRPAR